MRRLTWAALAIVGMFAWLDGQSARAQGPYVQPMTNPYARPAVSPYLNLARGGNPGINYYGIVRPQLQFNSSLLQLQQAQVQDAADLSQLVNQGVLITGVRAQYMNFSHYYGGRVTNAANLRPTTVQPAITPRATMPLLNQVTQGR